jgi:hypothetical protein
VSELRLFVEVERDARDVAGVVGQAFEDGRDLGDRDDEAQVARRGLAVRSSLVRSFLATTLAPATTAPTASRTTPAIRPVSVCAEVGADAKSVAAQASARAKRRERRLGRMDFIGNLCGVDECFGDGCRANA